MQQERLILKLNKKELALGPIVFSLGVAESPKWLEISMEWNSRMPALKLADLENTVEKAGASESVAIVAILWGIAIIIAATNAP